ncbi:copper chaperone [Pseudorhizobium halotolerans]|jgi:Predicted lipoprotein involved in nitrous oxide reduction|uniref:Copper chaperone n=1 Tax=Pseudorhizobium halotolerans TaxID=1233081 RepID=A0ABM8PWC6_9HYPH|nr:nitrous oxide reductase accessory protein NosL [Pseudorhizobium halotolerans]CAD7052029.1 copper chaperone [Pseudorhizobium halotolerans]
MRLPIFAAVLASSLVLLSCSKEEAEAPPPPFALTEDAMGRYCGMNVLEHPGPKGQIILEHTHEAIWFSSARDTLAFTMLPEEPRDIAAIYVSDMGKAPSWEEPGATNWVDARQAFYVIDSTEVGGMGTAEAVPFAKETDAQAFTKQHGGRIVAFDGVPQDYILGSDPASEAGPGPIDLESSEGNHDHG